MLNGPVHFSVLQKRMTNNNKIRNDYLRSLIRFELCVEFHYPLIENAAKELQSK